MAMSFTGTNQYIDVGYLDVPSNTTEMTICHFYIHSATSDDRLVSKANGQQVNDHWWMTGVNISNKFQFRLKTGSTTTALVGKTSTSPGQFWWAAATYVSRRGMSLWLNRIDGVNSTPFNDGNTSKSGNVARDSRVRSWLAGNPSGASDRPWRGFIFDVRVYERALDLNEMTTIVSLLGQDDIKEGLLWRWPLSEGYEGKIAKDRGEVKDYGEAKRNGDPVNGPRYEFDFPQVPISAPAILR